MHALAVKEGARSCCPSFGCEGCVPGDLWRNLLLDSLTGLVAEHKPFLLQFCYNFSLQFLFQNH